MAVLGDGAGQLIIDFIGQSKVLLPYQAFHFSSGKTFQHQSRGYVQWYQTQVNYSRTSKLNGQGHLNDELLRD
jgi:hypothetical protein